MDVLQFTQGFAGLVDDLAPFADEQDARKILKVISKSEEAMERHWAIAERHWEESKRHREESSRYMEILERAAEEFSELIDRATAPN